MAYQCYNALLVDYRNAVVNKRLLSRFTGRPVVDN